MKLKIKEIHSVYIDSLEEWVEIPLYESSSVDKFMGTVGDWDHYSPAEYKKLLMDVIDLEVKVRNNINSHIFRDAVHDEIYNFIISKNPGLKPRFSPGLQQPHYTEEESRSVMEWFATNKNKGRRPEVVSDEGAE